MAAFEMNLPDRAVRAFARFRDRLTQGRNREDATAGGHDLSILLFRSSMENPHRWQTGGIFQSLDSFSGVVFPGIAAGGKNDSDCRLRIEFNGNAFEATFDCCHQ